MNKQLCKQTRGVLRSQAGDLGEYDVFVSERHQSSEKTRELYKARYLRLPDEEGLRIAFPHAGSVASQIKPKRGRFEEHEKIAAKDYPFLFERLVHEREFYYRERKGKNGKVRKIKEYFERKKQPSKKQKAEGKEASGITGSGIVRTFVTLPKQYSLALSDAVEERRLSPSECQEILAKAASFTLGAMAARTGYQSLTATVHPETTENVHFHLNLGKVDAETHELLGRSKSKQKGRKGLKMLGRSLLNVVRYDRIEALPHQLMVGVKKVFSLNGAKFDARHEVDVLDNSGFDDVAINNQLENYLRRLLPKDLLKRSDEIGKATRQEWLDRVQEQFQGDGGKKSKKDLLKEIEELKQRKTRISDVGLDAELELQAEREEGRRLREQVRGLRRGLSHALKHFIPDLWKDAVKNGRETTEVLHVLETIDRSLANGAKQQPKLSPKLSTPANLSEIISAAFNELQQHGLLGRPQSKPLNKDWRRSVHLDEPASPSL